uniref:Uncharacterized protein MANES_07G017700 n=1 Tax=Rhizophora mucronata TaxID=61149 RepID=A0A2P2KNF6_RHIMU
MASTRSCVCGTATTTATAIAATPTTVTATITASRLSFKSQGQSNAAFYAEYIDINNNYYKKKKTKLANYTTLISSNNCSRPLIARASPPSSDLSPPPIDHDLLQKLTAEGAKVSEDGIIETFDNDDEALDAFSNGALVSDLSHFGRIKGMHSVP